MDEDELAASYRENYGFFGGEACAVGAGVTLPDGRTPAPESGAAEADGCVAAGFMRI